MVGKCGFQKARSHKEKGLVDDMEYLLMENRTEIGYRNREEIKPGCAANEPDPDVIKIFDDKNEAMQCLTEFQTDIQELSGASGIFFAVTERYIEECENDDPVGILEFSLMEIKLVGELGDTIETFDNYADAEKAYNDYDGDEEVRISLW